MNNSSWNGREHFIKRRFQLINIYALQKYQLMFRSFAIQNLKIFIYLVHTTTMTMDPYEQIFRYAKRKIRSQGQSSMWACELSIKPHEFKKKLI